jgi:hypothetical protein
MVSNPDYNPTRLNSLYINFVHRQEVSTFNFAYGAIVEIIFEPQ